MEIYYIAYGSNLNISQMKARCPQAQIVGTSIIKDYQLYFKGSPTSSYLTIERKVGSTVPVGVWLTTKADEISLDKYEDYPNTYYKAEMELPIKDIKTGEIKNHICYIYIMHEDRKIGIPTDKYLTTCSDGYKDFGFDKDVLLNALKESQKLSQE